MITLPPEFEADIQGQNLNLYPIVSIGQVISEVTDSEADLTRQMLLHHSFFEHSGMWDSFSVGDYIKIDSEYMRVENYTPQNVIVARGLLGSDISVHNVETNVYMLDSLEGELDISTKDATLSPYADFNFHYKPLLLNIPSIKESMDFENRNYKISDVTLKISNYEYDGERFSDYAGNLINTRVVISWVSQSKSILPVYSGFIRRYSHDDEICTLQLEDSTQRDLHKDVPVSRLGDGDEVPDKYKNKPIPMVYGHVDRSPCVLNYETEDEITLDVDVITEKGKVESYQTENQFNMHYYNPLFINEAGTYVSIENRNIRLGTGFDTQYILEPEVGRIKIPVDFTGGEGGDAGSPVNHMANGELEGKIVRKAMAITPINHPPYTQWDIGGDEGMVYDFIDYFYDLDKAKNPPDYGYLDPINIPAGHVAGVNCEVVDIGLGYDCETYASLKVQATRPSEAPMGSNGSNANLYIDPSNQIFDIGDTDVEHTFDNVNQSMNAFDKELIDWDTINSSNVFQVKSSTHLFERFNISVKYHLLSIVQHCIIPAPLDKDFYVNVNGRTLVGYESIER